MQKQTFGEMGN